MPRLSLRMLIGLLVPLTLAFSVTLPAAAQDPAPVAGSAECEGCHEGLRAYWESSSHGQALADPVFQQAWEEAGRKTACLACHTTGFDPATGTYAVEGVACTACHAPVPANHPDNWMPTDVSSRLCGACHLETYAEWEESQHGAEEMACGQCHNPHTTALRASDTQQLCQTCHQEEGHFYAMTSHAQSGILCTECHLRVMDGEPPGEGHGQRQHSFTVDLDTCNHCHLTDMHAPTTGEASGQSSLLMAETLARASVAPAADLSPDPPQLSPLMLVLPAGFGLLFGVLLAPWMERWGQRRALGGK